MLPVVVLALWCARRKKQRLSVLWCGYALYPFFAAELVYLACQVSVLLGYYWAVAYAPMFKFFFLFPLVIPVIAYELYYPALAGSACVVLGSVMNQIAIAYNGGKMPVYPTLSRLTGYFSENAMLRYDALHTLGNEATRFKVFTDYIDLGYSILSLGDVLIRVFIFLILYYSVVRLNDRAGLQKEN